MDITFDYHHSSKEAEKFAEDKPIELIDGQKLIKYIRLAENK